MGYSVTRLESVIMTVHHTKRLPRLSKKYQKIEKISKIVADESQNRSVSFMFSAVSLIILILEKENFHASTISKILLVLRKSSNIGFYFLGSSAEIKFHTSLNSNQLIFFDSRTRT